MRLTHSRVRFPYVMPAVLAYRGGYSLSGLMGQQAGVPGMSYGVATLGG